MNKLLTIEQMAESLEVKVSHLRKMVNCREIPYIKVGRLVRFCPEQIGEWLFVHQMKAIDRKQNIEEKQGEINEQI